MHGARLVHRLEQDFVALKGIMIGELALHGDSNAPHDGVLPFEGAFDLVLIENIALDDRGIIVFRHF